MAWTVVRTLETPEELLHSLPRPHPRPRSQDLLVRGGGASPGGTDWQPRLKPLGWVEVRKSGEDRVRPRARGGEQAPQRPMRAGEERDGRGPAAASAGTGCRGAGGGLARVGARIPLESLRGGGGEDTHTRRTGSRLLLRLPKSPFSKDDKNPGGEEQFEVM